MADVVAVQGNHFPIAEIEQEDHADGLAIPARQLKHIRTPAEIGAECADHAVVRAVAPYPCGEPATGRSAA